MKYFWMVFISVVALTAFACKMGGGRVSTPAAQAVAFDFDEPVAPLGVEKPVETAFKAKAELVPDIRVELLTDEEIQTQSVKRHWSQGQIDHVVWKITVIKKRGYDD